MKILKSVLKFTASLVLTLAALSFVCHFILVPVEVHGNSMEPVLHDGDFGISYSTNIAKIERFDIVIIDMDDGTSLVKRVIGMPGELVMVEDNILYINGEMRAEPFINREHVETSSFTWQLADDEYFVMGDNREYSSDSRKYGGFKKEQIVAIGFMPLFNSNNIGGE